MKIEIEINDDTFETLVLMAKIVENEFVVDELGNLNYFRKEMKDKIVDIIYSDVENVIKNLLKSEISDED
jgi:predicted methyltransferase